MNKKGNIHARPWLYFLAGLVMLFSFFLPWVKWENTLVRGNAPATGDFFKISEEVAGLGNPFPAFEPALYVFWLIPVLIIIAMVSFWKGGRSLVPAGLAVMLSLSLVTVFLLFSRILVTLGTGNNLAEMVQPWLYVHGVASLVFIFAHPSPAIIKKIAWVLAGPVFAFLTFTFIENYLSNKTHNDTSDVKAEYTLPADELIREFVSNDSAANAKYFDRVLVINGKAFAIDILADSTSTIRFADSTGSYAIFSLEKTELPEVKKLASGSEVSLKGVCSGSIFSEILGTTSISFKRAILNHNKK